MKWDDGTLFEGIWNADQRVSGTLKLTTGVVKYIFYNLYILDLYWYIQE